MNCIVAPSDGQLTAGHSRGGEEGPSPPGGSERQAGDDRGHGQARAEVGGPSEGEEPLPDAPPSARLAVASCCHPPSPSPRCRSGQKAPGTLAVRAEPLAGQRRVGRAEQVDCSDGARPSRRFLRWASTTGNLVQRPARGWTVCSCAETLPRMPRRLSPMSRNHTFHRQELCALV